MQTFVRIAILLTAGAILAGCGEWASPQNKASLGPKEQPAPGTGVAYLRETSVKGDTGLETAGEDSAKWSDRYSRAVEEMVRTQQQKHDLEEQNRKALGEMAKLRAEIEQYTKELGEANGMLIEMRQELDKWKANVLGFREEMRKAETAQLDALRKILELLGGEAPKPTAQPTTQPANQLSVTKDVPREMVKGSN